jgi:hypothetical protein
VARCSAELYPRFAGGWRAARQHGERGGGVRRASGTQRAWHRRQFTRRTAQPQRMHMCMNTHTHTHVHARTPLRRQQPTATGACCAAARPRPVHRQLWPGGSAGDGAVPGSAGRGQLCLAAQAPPRCGCVGVPHARPPPAVVRRPQALLAPPPPQPASPATRGQQPGAQCISSISSDSNSSSGDSRRKWCERAAWCGRRCGRRCWRGVAGSVALGPVAAAAAAAAGACVHDAARALPCWQAFLHCAGTACT